jgi:hypothetical protein
LEEATLVQQPEALNKHYYDLFVKTLKVNIPKYEKCEKRFITPTGTVEPVTEFDPSGRVPIIPAMVGRHADYIYFRGNLSVDKADLEVEAVVRLLAEREASAIEDIIEQTRQHGAAICYDLFKLSDGTPNLRTFYFVKGNEPTKDDPTGSITGWFAYKLSFTVNTKLP